MLLAGRSFFNNTKLLSIQPASSQDIYTNSIPAVRDELPRSTRRSPLSLDGGKDEAMLITYS